MGTEAPQQERQWDGLVRRSIDISVRGVDKENRSVRVIASSDSIDSHGDILEQDWRLDRYRKNPVVLWHHNQFDSSHWSMGGASRPEDFLPIGKGQDVDVVDNKLEATLVFATEDVNPMGDRIFKMFAAGMLSAVSVGFRPGRVTREQLEGKTVFRLGNNELMEISVVPIPSNPDAVAKSVAFERKQLSRLCGADDTSREGGQETNEMAMTPEEKQAFENALADAKSTKERAEKLEKDIAEARSEAKKATDRAEAAEKALDVEKAAVEQYKAELDTATKRADEAEGKVLQVEIKALSGIKFAPSELEEEIELAKAVGLERRLEMLNKRPDLKMLRRATAGGKPLQTTETAPEPVEDDEYSDESTKFADELETKIGIVA